ncbi:MAG TPA: hypothetical protein VGB27_00750, partial [Candidatus Binatia bacterium]
RIKLNLGVMFWQIMPHFLHHTTGIVQARFTVYDVTKEYLPISRHHRNKIRTRLAIIVICEPYRPPVMLCWIVFHKLRYIAP